MGKFIVGDYITSQGYNLVGGDQNNPIVQDEAGNEFTFNVPSMLQEKGVDWTKVDIQLNTPDTALQQSPVGIADRAALSFGDDKGKIKYLRGKFKEAAVNGDGLVVNDKGVWKQVDPDSFSDPWEAAKDIADWAGVAPVVAGSILGGTAGAAAGPAGAAGGAAAGSGAGEGARIAAGKILGTYDGGAEDIAKDVGIEMLLSMGGSAVAAGVKPGLKGLSAGIKRVAQEAGPRSKEAYVGFASKITGVKEKAFEVATGQYSDDVARHFQTFGKRGIRSVEQLDQFVSPIQEKAAQKFLEVGTKALPKAYEKSLDTFYDIAGKTGFKADVSGIIRQSLEEIGDMGLGILEKRGKSLAFRPFSAAEIAARRAAGKGTQEFTTQQLKAASSMLGNLTRRSQVGKLKGRAAAEELSLINKFINDQVTDSSDDGVKRVLTMMRDSFHKRFTGALAAHDESVARGLIGRPDETYPSLAAQWSNGHNLYEEFRAAVSGAKQTLRQDQGARVFADRLLASSAAGRGAQGRAGALIRLAQISGKQDGDLAQKLFKDIVTLETARQFSPIFPRVGFWSSGATTAGASLGFVTGGPAGAATVLGLSSPRLTYAQLRAAKAVGKLGNLGADAIKADQFIETGSTIARGLRNLSQPARTQLLQNEEAMRALTSQALGALFEDNPSAEGAGLVNQEISQ